MHIVFYIRLRFQRESDCWDQTRSDTSLYIISPVWTSFENFVYFLVFGLLKESHFFCFFFIIFSDWCSTLFVSRRYCNIYVLLNYRLGKCLTSEIESFASVRRIWTRIGFCGPGTRNGSRQQVVIRARGTHSHERIGSPCPRIGPPTRNDCFLWLKIDYTTTR